MSIVNEAQWYIATCIIGNEDVVYKELEDKIRAFRLNDVVKEIKLLKSREITIEVFDNKDNPPPKLMRNTKSITWTTLPGNRYKKTRIREINRFPGYIYIKMIMEEQAWYVIRNTFGITGFVGSSGKGAKPIPMSEFEVERLFNEASNEDIIINKSGISYVEDDLENLKPIEDVDTKFDEPEVVAVHNKPFVVNIPNNDDYYDSTKVQNNEENSNDNQEVKLETTNVVKEDINESNQDSNNESIYLENENEPQVFDFDINDKDLENIKVGTFVTIKSGEMVGEKGNIISIDKTNNMVKVEIDMFGRKSVIDVSIADIELGFENN